MSDLSDEDHEAKGAMLHAMSTRDYHREQADEVERLRADVARLREALVAVESWWLSEGMSMLAGAPFCIFHARRVLAETAPDRSTAG